MVEARVNSERSISVIVPHYEDPNGLDICLSALSRQTLTPLEIIVSDNNSPMGEIALNKLIGGRARLVITKQRGAGPARNGGVDIASGQILAFTDSDCVPDSEWLAQGVDVLNRYGFVGGRVKVLVDNPAIMTGPEAFESVFAFDNEAYVLRKGFTVTANLFCRREMFRKVGGFRVGVSEDLEWSQRAIAAGYTIGYAPNAVVGHPARRNWNELKKKWRRLNAEQFALLREQPHGTRRYMARAVALPFSAIAHTPNVLLSKELHTTSQRLGALATLYRLRMWRAADAFRLLSGR